MLRKFFIVFIAFFVLVGSLLFWYIIPMFIVLHSGLAIATSQQLRLLFQLEDLHRGLLIRFFHCCHFAKLYVVNYIFGYKDSNFVDNFKKEKQRKVKMINNTNDYPKPRLREPASAPKPASKPKPAPEPAPAWQPWAPGACGINSNSISKIWKYE